MPEIPYGMIIPSEILRTSKQFIAFKVLNDAWEIGDYNSHSFGLILANCKVI